jgi:hypothetical protein
MDSACLYIMVEFILKKDLNRKTFSLHLPKGTPPLENNNWTIAFGNALFHAHELASTDEPILASAHFQTKIIQVKGTKQSPGHVRIRLNDLPNLTSSSMKSFYENVCDYLNRNHMGPNDKVVLAV